MSSPTGTVVVVAEPTREVIELAVDGERVLYIVEPVAVQPGAGGASVTDHGDLTGLDADDHPQYHTDARGDARYYQRGTVDAALALKADESALAAVATSGAYADLSGRPTIPAAYADLTGQVPTSALPALAITEVFTVADEAAMLALTAQRGDMAIRTDLSGAFVLASDTPGVLADWKRLSTPADAVLSINGQTGVVVLAKGDVGLGQVANLAPADLPVSTATAAAVATRAADAAVVHLAGNETVTGAKDFIGGLNANGSAVVVTTDPRMSDARTPTAHGHPAGQISGLAAVATSGAYADLSGRPVTPGFCDPAARRHGLLSMTAAPNLQDGSARPPSGRLNTWRLPIDPGTTISRVAVLLADLATGPGSCWLMVNQLNGVRLGQTVDIGSAGAPSPITSGGINRLRFFDLTAPGVTTGDAVYITLLSTMSSGPNIVFGRWVGGNEGWWNTPGRLTAFRSDPGVHSVLPNDATFIAYVAAGIPWVDMIVGVAA
jgi:hypothetical protein